MAQEAPTMPLTPRTLSKFTAHPEGMGSMLRLTEAEGSSLRSTVFNLSNTMIGGGILGLPFAMQQNGWAFGVMLLLLVTVASDVTTWMLLYCVDATKEGSYAMVAENLVGPKLGILVDVIIFINILGTCTSYIVIIGDIVPPFLHFLGAPGIFQDRSTMLVVVALAVLLPLSSLRHLGALRYVSLACLAVILLLVAVLTCMAAGLIEVSRPGDAALVSVSSDPLAILGQFPVLLFAFNCHMNVPILYRELRKQTFLQRESRWQTKRAKMMSGIHASFALVFFLYGIAACAGYIAFRDRTEHDILTNFSDKVWWLSPYVKVVYSVAIICSFPVMCYSGVASFHRLLWQMATGFEHDECGDPYHEKSVRGAVFRFMRLGSDFPEAPATPRPAARSDDDLAVYAPIISPPQSRFAPPFAGDEDEPDGANADVWVMSADMGNGKVELPSDEASLEAPLLKDIWQRQHSAGRFDIPNADVWVMSADMGNGKVELPSDEASLEAPLLKDIWQRQHSAGRFDIPTASALAHFVEAALVTVAALFIAIVLPDVSTVFGLTGSASTAVVCWQSGLF
eukprot:TRINITY_DN21221_c0_g1_i5.p1 TRINITY_DN21221_c0_g1~~TRINITY_DN21221_c0_g1_i5.p1  ORF type:complete len:567 (-),score=107.66 TRINITY_DN21221_c0_g1_i5:330-2030(-)